MPIIYYNGSETLSEIGSDCTPPERKFHVYYVFDSVREIKEVRYNNDKSCRQKV